MASALLTFPNTTSDLIWRRPPAATPQYDRMYAMSAARDVEPAVCVGLANHVKTWRRTPTTRLGQTAAFQDSTS
jgi:hypothetical protein